ncbi:hypothetical protein VitviT2T_020965 [Vitis vinifera]|uniref:Uncharacterized protein n=1 Tax=Vitis vinifera TaxID=29760 RepID=A0ABY9D5L9_VITVI|nr:hypothetical protein VitviT2T_020965 [Vitis vinifera]
MEGQQERRNVGEKEGGQPSRNSGQTGPESKERRIDIVEISHKVKNWIESLKKCRRKDSISKSMAKDTKGSSHAEGDPGFQQIYEPRVISISPYHHGKPHLHPGEMIKPLCAPNFLDDSKQDIEALYTKLKVI